MTAYKFLVGFVLTVAMIAVLGATALLFASRDFQFGVAQIAPSTNGLVDFHRLAEVDAQISQLKAETAEPRGQLLQVQSQLASLESERQAQQQALNDARSAIVGNIATVESHSAQQPAQSAAANLETQALSSRIQSLASRSGLAPADQQTVAGLRSQVQQLAIQEQALDNHGAERAQLEAQQRLLDLQVNDSNRQIFALQQTVVPDYEQYERVRGEAFALRTMSPLGVSASLAQGHPALLSTALVMLMGALGALLYLFPAYLTRPVPVTMAEIVVRLIFGACAALAFYVLANATIAGFSFTTEVRQATTSATLNPFTVSLIGIVAGVLAEDIAKWIQDRGRGIFQQGGAPAPAPAPAQPASDQGFTGVNPHGGPNAP